MSLKRKKVFIRKEKLVSIPEDKIIFWPKNDPKSEEANSKRLRQNNYSDTSFLQKVLKRIKLEVTDELKNPCGIKNPEITQIFTENSFLGKPKQGWT